MKFMISQFFSKKSKKSDNWMTEENSKIISRFEYFLASLEKDGINLVVSTGVVKSSQVGCGDQMFFRLHAVLPSREKPRNFVFRVNRETARFDPTTRPFTQSRAICIYVCMYVYTIASCGVNVYIRKIHGSKIASRPEKDIVRVLDLDKRIS